MKVILCLLASVFFFTSCASNKPVNLNSNPGLTEKVSKSGLSLHGSSDDNSAGALQTVYFPKNVSHLDARAKSNLKLNADFLKSNPNIILEVQGHCDERGSRQYNLALGERRAKIIQKYLNALGVKSSRINTISYGKEKPLANGRGESSWSQNRRGNFVIVGI
jgi:peptidoglycan-associated lipoprotein